MKTEWISVKDRLPEEDVNVLCYSHSDFIEGYYCSNDKCFKPELDCIGYMENDIMKIDVTHWMPLPKPPAKLTITPEEKQKLEDEIIAELKEAKDWFGSWDELRRVIDNLENNENEAAAERYYNEPDAWAGGFADNH